MKHLLNALGSRRHKLSDAVDKVDQVLADVQEARDVKAPEQFADALDKVLSELRSSSDAHAFLKPVTKSDAPDYHLVIKHPMDLATVGRKVRTRQYKTKAEFVTDLNLIWDNCLSYNASPSHPLRRCANSMRRRAGILVDNVYDPSERSAPLTLRKMPSHLRRRSVIDDLDDDYSSASGKSNGSKPRTNGIAKMDGAVYTNGRSNGINGINGRVSSTPESDVPARSSMQRSQGARCPPPEEPFAERTAILRSTEGMSQFATLDKELQSDDGLQRHLDTAGAGPSRLAPDNGFLREESARRVRSQLRQIRQNDEDLQRLDEWREVDESKTTTGLKRKRLVIASSDDEPDDPPRRTKFSTVGLPPSQEDSETNTDLWWEAMRSGNAIGSGMLSMAQHGFPPIKPNTTRRRKKRPKTAKADETRPGLTNTIYKNISTLHNIRRAHTKIIILNATAEDPNAHMPPVNDDEPEQPPRPPIPGLTFAEDSGAHCLNRVSSTVLEHAGFEGSSQGSLNVLQHVAADYIMNMGRTFRFMCDKFGHTMSNEQIILHCLSEHGISGVQDLERYVKDDVERYGTRLQDLERKLNQSYTEQIGASAIEEDGLFDEENEEFAMGGFTEDLGEDFFGLRELGLERELGLTSLAVPKRLLRGRQNNAANANSANREPPLPYPPPPSFIPISTGNLDSQIGLLHSFYSSRAGASAAPPPGGAQAATVLPDDPINPLKVKMGPLGQIVPVVANASKKKGGGGGGGGGSGGGQASGAVSTNGPADTIKQENAPKDSKKKKTKPPAPAPTEQHPVLMPKFGVNKSSMPPPPEAPPPAMMSDYSAFVNGVHAGA